MFLRDRLCGPVVCCGNNSPNVQTKNCNEGFSVCALLLLCICKVSWPSLRYKVSRPSLCHKVLGQACVTKCPGQACVTKCPGQACVTKCPSQPQETGDRGSHSHPCTTNERTREGTKDGRPGTGVATSTHAQLSKNFWLDFV